MNGRSRKAVGLAMWENVTETLMLRARMMCRNYLPEAKSFSSMLPPPAEDCEVILGSSFSPSVTQISCRRLWRRILTHEHHTRQLSQFW